MGNMNSYMKWLHEFMGIWITKYDFKAGFSEFLYTHNLKNMNL